MFWPFTLNELFWWPQQFCKFSAFTLEFPNVFLSLWNYFSSKKVRTISFLTCSCRFYRKFKKFCLISDLSLFEKNALVFRNCLQTFGLQPRIYKSFSQSLKTFFLTDNFRSKYHLYRFQKTLWPVKWYFLTFPACF